MSLSLLPGLRRLFALAVIAALPAWSAPSLTDPMPVDPNVRTGTLANGLHYYIRHNGRPAQRVELRLVVDAGAVLEDEDQRGLAHFVEHMAFNGSTHFKKHELVAYLQSIGVRFGADLNAATGFDNTTFMLPVPVDKPGNLEQGFQVLEDWAHGLTLGSEQIDDERNIILEEKRLRSGYAQRRLAAILPRQAGGSRYQDRLPIGTEDAILHAPPEAVRRFYREWYRPDLMAVIVVGDVDPLVAERLVQHYFNGLAMPAAPRPRTRYPLPPLAAQDALVFVDKEAPTSSVELTWSVFERPPAVTVGDFRAELVRRLFTTLMDMQLTGLTHLAAPPLVHGFSGETAVPFGRNVRAWTSGAIVGKAGVGAAIDALETENERAREYGFNATAFELARRNLLASIEHAYQARDTRDSAALIGAPVRHFLSGEAMPGIENEYAYASAFLPGITLEEMNAYARATIPTGAPKRVLYTTNGAGGAVPSGDELLARAALAHKPTRINYTNKALPATLMAGPPQVATPGRIVEESVDKTLGITHLLLSNGVKVMLKPTDFSKDAVQMLALRPGGQMLFADADMTALRYAASVRSAMGVADYSPSDLRRILAGKDVSLSPGMTPYADQLVGASRSADIETMLQLNYLAMTQPRRDDRLFRDWARSNAEAVRNRAAIPEARFADARAETVFGKHPRLALQPRPEDFESLDMNHVLALERSRLGSAKGMTFLFIGDFDVEAIKPLLASYVATLPVDELPLHYRDPGIRQIPGVIRREFKAGLEQKSTVAFDFGGDLAYSKPESTAFRDMIAVLNLRITDGLRERDKLIYSGGASGTYRLTPRGEYGVSIRLPTSPRNVPKVEAALWAEIERLQAQGPDAQDLDKVKQAQVQGYRKAMHENGYWLQYMRTAVEEGSDLHDILSVEQRTNAVTAAEVQAAAKRFLNRAQYVEMVLLPEN